MRPSLTKVIGAGFALAAFSVAIFAGMSTGNSAVEVLGKAILALLVCYAGGLIVGGICEHVVDDHVRMRQKLQSEVITGGVGNAVEAGEEVKPVQQIGAKAA